MLIQCKIFNFQKFFVIQLTPLNVITSQTVSYHINQLFFSKVKQMGTMKCEWLITWTMITLSGSHCFTTYALLNRFQFMKLLSFLNLVVVIPLVILHALLSPLLSTRYFFLYYKTKPAENLIPGKDLADNTECKTEYK